MISSILTLGPVMEFDFDISLLKLSSLCMHRYLPMVESEEQISEEYAPFILRVHPYQVKTSTLAPEGNE